MVREEMMQKESLRYRAFISYRHADNKILGRQWATWLHQAIETFEVPTELVGKQNERGQEIPARIYPIFRDEEELPAHADLAGSITNALEQSQLLIVLCSPRAVESTYVADEIDYFKKLGNSKQIIAAIIDGEPNASWDKGKLNSGFAKEDECFPVPLQFEYDKKGEPTEKRAEPIAADFRLNVDGRPEQSWTSQEAYRQHLVQTTDLDKKELDTSVEKFAYQQNLMLLKIIAGILGLPLGELTQRDKEHQLALAQQKTRKLRRWLSVVGLLAIFAVGAGITAYFQMISAIESEKIAVSQRHIAESNQAKNMASLGVENWKKSPSANALSTLVKAVELANGAEKFEYATIMNSMMDNFVSLSTAFRQLDSPVVTWNGSTYAELGNQIYKLSNWEAARYYKTDLKIFLIDTYGAMVIWNTNSKETAFELTDKTMTESCGIYQRVDSKELFLPGFNGGPTGGSTGFRKYFVDLQNNKISEKEFATIDVESGPCGHGEYIGYGEPVPVDFERWKEVGEEPARLTFPKVKALRVVQELNAISKKLPASIQSDIHYEFDKNEEIIGLKLNENALPNFNNAKPMLELLYAQDSIPDRMYEPKLNYHPNYLHTTMTLSAGNSGRHEQFCLYTTTINTCFDWNATTNEEFNNNESQSYASNSGRLVVILTGNQSLLGTKIKKWNEVSEKYEDLALDSGPQSGYFEDADITGDEKTVVLADFNTAWLYRVGETKLERLHIYSGLPERQLVKVRFLDQDNIIVLSCYSGGEPGCESDEFSPKPASEFQWFVERVNVQTGVKVWDADITRQMKIAMSESNENSEQYERDGPRSVRDKVELIASHHNSYILVQSNSKLVAIDKHFGFLFGGVQSKDEAVLAIEGLERQVSSNLTFVADEGDCKANCVYSNGTLVKLPSLSQQNIDTLKRALPGYIGKVDTQSNQIIQAIDE